MLLVSSIRRTFTIRSARDYVPQIDKIAKYNTKGWGLKQHTRTTHPDTLQKQKQVG